jgi:anti-sigma factor RsiW
MPRLEGRHTTLRPLNPFEKSHFQRQARRRASHIDLSARGFALQGFEIRSWSDRGLNFRAVSELGADELAEFSEKFESAMRTNKEG